MKGSVRKLELASVDDLFTTEESRREAGQERVQEIPLAELFPFEGHPFSVREDERMTSSPRPLPVPEKMEDTKSSPGIGGSGPASWQDWKPCR